MGHSTIHTAEHLAEQLMTLGHQLNVSYHINEILSGQRAIMGVTALRLRRFLGVNPQFWLDRQTIHDSRVAEQKTGAVIKTSATLNVSYKNYDSKQPRREY